MLVEAGVSQPAELSPDAFRRVFREWLGDNLPPKWTDRPFPQNWPPGDDDAEAVLISREWHQRLYEGGWIAPGWPREHGGLGLPLSLRMVMTEELARAKAPAPVGFQGIDILGPALIAFGTPGQRSRFLPEILSANELWCQGYSEPEAGSDLASLKTRAVREGDHYVVNGQKVWTSYGNRADWCFLLVRTGPADSGKRGISFVLTPMSAKGIEWRPIRQITGERHFGELFLHEVHIPCENLVGAENQGWLVATHSLAHERLLSGNVAAIRSRMDALIDLATRRGATVAARRSIATLEARLLGVHHLQTRALDLASAGASDFAWWASAVKLASTELRQDIAAVATEILGGSAVLGDHPEGEAWRYELLDARAATIYAGTSEIQRTIIAEHGLGLPRG